ncbi:MAG TPA: hypothetical protein VKA08_12105, partial [Balneolales bacterium]|nr:hypothetical protein [Balneolales bacterium]
MKSVASSYGSIGFNMVYLNKDTGFYDPVNAIQYYIHLYDSAWHEIYQWSGYTGSSGYASFYNSYDQAVYYEIFLFSSYGGKVQVYGLNGNTTRGYYEGLVDEDVGKTITVTL